MIIDYKKDPDHAREWMILDLDTGKYLCNSLRVFYADDTLGIIRYYVVDEEGLMSYDPATKGIVSKSESRNIKIVPRD